MYVIRPTTYTENNIHNTDWTNQEKAIKLITSIPIHFKTGFMLSVNRKEYEIWAIEMAYLLSFLQQRK